MNDSEQLELEGDAAGVGEWESPDGLEAERALDEVEELELAVELLGAQNERELDRFLGKLLHRSLSAGAGGRLERPVGGAIGGLLKGAIHKVLPGVGGSVGSGADGLSRERLAGNSGPILGLELEGLSAEDQELEVARRLVRLGEAAVANALNVPPGSPAVPAARAAVKAAALQHAPGLLPSMQAPQAHTCSCRHSSAPTGRWDRQGETVVLHGV